MGITFGDDKKMDWCAGGIRFFYFLKFRSFRSIQTIALPGGVMDPYQGQTRVGETEKSSQKAQSDKKFFF